MKADLTRVKAVLRKKLVLSGRSGTRTEQLAPESDPLVAADVLVREDPDDEEEEDEEDKDDEEGMKATRSDHAARLARLDRAQYRRKI